MKLTIVSNGTKGGTFVRNSDTGEALENVESVSFDFDGNDCVAVITTRTSLLLMGKYAHIADTNTLTELGPKKAKGPLRPLAYADYSAAKKAEEAKLAQDAFMDPAGALNELESKAVQDSFFNPDNYVGKPVPEPKGRSPLSMCVHCRCSRAATNFILSCPSSSNRTHRMIDVCPVCYVASPAHAHHCEEGGVHLSTKHIPAVAPTSVEVAQIELGASVLPKHNPHPIVELEKALSKDPTNPYLRQALRDHGVPVAPMPPFPGQCASTTLDAFGIECRCEGAGDHLYEHWSGPVRWDDRSSADRDPEVSCQACGLSSYDTRAADSCNHLWPLPYCLNYAPVDIARSLPTATEMLKDRGVDRKIPEPAPTTKSLHEPLSHCYYCKTYYCDVSQLKGHVDQRCPESNDHEHQWMPPLTKGEEPRVDTVAKPPVLPTRVGYVAGKPEYVGKFETRKEIPIGKDPYLELVGQYPHCDAYVLHARGTCEFCDLPSNAPLHEWRKATNTNYTGEHDPLKGICPAELRRPKANIDKWYGNTAKPKESK